VIGRGRPVIPLKMELTPYGFFGAVQAVQGKNRDAPAIAAEVVELLIDDKRTNESMIEALVRQLLDAHSYNQANKLVRLLAKNSDLVDQDQYDRMRDAQDSNSQVSGAYDVDGHLHVIAERLKPPTLSRAIDDVSDEPWRP
jgi:hypothetical protein